MRMAGKPKYKNPPAAPMNQWVREALAHAGLSGPEVADKLSARLRRSYDRSIIQKMTVARKVSADEAAELSTITGYPLPINGDVEVRIARYLLLSAEDQKIVDGVVDGLFHARKEAHQ